MTLQLFDFIEDTMHEYERRYASFEYAEKVLKSAFTEIVEGYGMTGVTVHSRIKSYDSLKEKLLRNKFYRNCRNGDEALANMHDLVGITLECQFIRNEVEIYNRLMTSFSRTPLGMSSCPEYPAVYLNLDMIQPQLQRNGFTIYRIDGFYDFNGEKICFELQIKALVHRFWSEIEHKVVYKNPDFVSYDRFIKDILSSVRDNLDIVDRQLELIYDQISMDTANKGIGFSETEFKRLTASSISRLINQKLNQSLGFTLDFKNASAMLAQYIYIREFINAEDPKRKMLDYFEHLNMLASSDMDFTQQIILEREFSSKIPFCDRLGKYFSEMINTDFEWHVFFIALFSVQSGSPSKELNDFTETMRYLLVQPMNCRDLFPAFSADARKQVQDALELTLADIIINNVGIRLADEETVYHISEVFQTFMQEVEETYKQPQKILDDIGTLKLMMRRQIMRRIK